MIQIRFIHGTSFDSKIIEWETRSWCSHVEAISHGWTFGAMFNGGVRERGVRDSCYRAVVRWEIWNIPCSHEQMISFWKFLRAQDGKPYDWRAVLSFGERHWQEDDSWFCSELMVAAGVAAKLWNFPKQIPYDRIDPGDAYLLFTTIPGAHL